MAYSYSLTKLACHRRRALPPGLRARLDSLITGLTLVPSIGRWDPEEKMFVAHVGSELRITYEVVPGRRPLVVVSNITDLQQRLAMATDAHRDH